MTFCLFQHLMKTKDTNQDNEQDKHHDTNAFSVKCAASGQNQQNGMCAQRSLRLALVSAQSDQSSLCAY